MRHRRESISTQRSCIPGSQHLMQRSTPREETLRHGGLGIDLWAGVRANEGCPNFATWLRKCQTMIWMATARLHGLLTGDALAFRKYLPGVRLQHRRPTWAPETLA
jgi:hypothetical protein